MKTDNAAFKLMDMGFKAETLASLTESQLVKLYRKLNEETVTNVKQSTYNTSDPADLTKLAQKMGGKVDTSTKKITLTNGKTENKKNEVIVDREIDEGKSKKSKKYNPWAICTSTVGRENKKKYERCVMDVKKSVKEGRDPSELFLENKILSLLERNIQPKITKGEFLQMIKESETVAPDKKREKITKPTTKPRPAHPGKNPNPGEHSAPKAGRISPEQAKDKIIDLIMNLLKK